MSDSGLAKKAYDEAAASARKMYEEAMASAQKAYEEATVSAWKAEEVFGHEKDFFTMKELAGRIGVCYRTVHRAVQDGKIKSVRFGGSVMIPRQEVERVLQQGF
jgi:excisionase family DNA binding protein